MTRTLMAGVASSIAVCLCACGHESVQSVESAQTGNTSAKFPVDGRILGTSFGGSALPMVVVDRYISVGRVAADELVVGTPGDTCAYAPDRVTMTSPHQVLISFARPETAPLVPDHGATACGASSTQHSTTLLVPDIDTAGAVEVQVEGAVTGQTLNATLPAV